MYSIARKGCVIVTIENGQSRTPDGVEVDIDTYLVIFNKRDGFMLGRFSHESSRSVFLPSTGGMQPGTIASLLLAIHDALETEM